jgi:hypothetical protein
VASLIADALCSNAQEVVRLERGIGLPVSKRLQSQFSAVQYGGLSHDATSMPRSKIQNLEETISMVRDHSFHRSSIPNYEEVAAEMASILCRFLATSTRGQEFEEAVRDTIIALQRLPVWLEQLRASRADLSYEKKLARFTSPDLLILDDIGLRPLVGDEPIDLFEVVRHRYERGAMVITSNRATEGGTLCSVLHCSIAPLLHCSPAPRWTGCCTTRMW